MGRYFKVIDKHRTDGRVDIVDSPAGSQVIYDMIDKIVEDKPAAGTGIPLSIEVDSWAEIACEGEIYETEDFVVECLSKDEYDEYTEVDYFDCPFWDPRYGEYDGDQEMSY